MCYLGIGDTFTAAHKDLCASSGHNLMCYTEQDGASYWFMTEGSAAPDVEEYFRVRLGHELDHETHAITLGQLRRAPFKVYVAKQVLGDLVLVPPRSVHQVVNFGGITLKTSWSRMCLKGLSTALHHELPLYQRYEDFSGFIGWYSSVFPCRVCRSETYRVKSTVFYSIQEKTTQLQAMRNARMHLRILLRSECSLTAFQIPTRPCMILSRIYFSFMLCSAPSSATSCVQLGKRSTDSTKTVTMAPVHNWTRGHAISVEQISSRVSWNAQDRDVSLQGTQAIPSALVATWKAVAARVHICIRSRFAISSSISRYCQQPRMSWNLGITTRRASKHRAGNTTRSLQEQSTCINCA